MSSSVKFLEAVQTSMKEKGMDFNAHEKQEARVLTEEEKQKMLLMNKLLDIEKRAIIKVSSLRREDVSINKDQLNEEMESSMVVHSNIIEDIYTLQLVMEEMKVVLNSVVGTLHHNLKFKNQFKLKTTKDLETHIAKDPLYNQINIRIKRVQSLIEKSENYSGMMKQKIGFIRDLTKMRTQEMFGNGNA